MADDVSVFKTDIFDDPPFFTHSPPAVRESFGVRREPIKKWPGYYVGNDGVIYSIKSGDFAPVATWLGGRKRCQYKKVSLYHKGAKGNFYVHDLVAVAFCGPRRRKTWQARHKDGDRFNNASSNLMWGTKRQNERDKIAAGTAPRGENHGASRLTKQDVEDILASPDMSTRFLAAWKNISASQVRKIRAGTAWAHLLAPLSPGP